jgi:hypothetical protein
MRNIGLCATLAILVAVGLALPAAAGSMLPPGVTPDSLSAEPALVRLDPQAIAFVRLKTVRNTAESRALISGTFTRIWSYLAQKGLTANGSPMEIMNAYEETDGSWLVSAAIPLAVLPDRVPEDAGDILFGTVGGGQAVQAAHRGDHWQIKRTHERIKAFIATGGRTAGGKVVEQHFDNPHKVPVEKLRSAVTYFLE